MLLARGLFPYLEPTVLSTNIFVIILALNYRKIQIKDIIKSSENIVFDSINRPILLLDKNPELLNQIKSLKI